MKPREFWLEEINEGDGIAPSYRVYYSEEPIGIHVREVIPDDEKGDKYLAMCKYVDLKNEELGRVTRALEKAKFWIAGEMKDEGNCVQALKQIEAIESGEE